MSLGAYKMVVLEKPITVAEFWHIAQSPENETRRLELDEGVIVEMAGSSPLNTVVAGRILHYLNAFVLPRDLGYVTGADGSFQLSPKQVRLPDVAFVAKTRLPRLPERFELPPDLAIEIVSEGEDILKKAREYLRAGTQAVWAVYAHDELVYVMTLNENGGIVSQPYDRDNTLDGGDLLSGFTLPLSAIFPD
jgi:Uma2 family endonuclease